MEEKQTVRTRFAPSPTGFLHVGGIRTALFAWLLARKHHGQFILRLEDTDRAREVSGSAEHIIQSLNWLGIDWDEGPDKGGMYGPYKQSERLQNYHAWARKLIDAGRAYADPYSQEEVEAFREKAKAEKKAFLYRDYRPENPSGWDGSQPLRFKSDPKDRQWTDAVMGNLSSGPESQDDFVLVKADGFPTYNFAHIVDDADMKITHIFRSQEFLSSTPRYLDLYEALELTPPVLATLPFVMAMDGKKKLGKRDGAKDVLDYSREGILPEAMLNFLASLGWNDGTEQEVFNRGELISKFDVSRVQKSPARFDEQRLWWMNGTHIRQLPLEELYELVSDYWPPASVNYPVEFKHRVLSLVQERMKKLSELNELSWFFFKDPSADERIVELMLSETGLDKPRATELFDAGIKICDASDFSAETLHDGFYALAEESKSKPAELFKLFRIAIVGGTIAPGLFETMSVLGKQTTLRRLTNIRNSF